jgi:hypothetical protein
MGVVDPIEVGDRFGRLVVRELVRIPKGNHPTHTVKAARCRCDDGNEIVVPLQQLRRGKAKSCGCLRRETAAATGRRTATTHGMRDHSLFETWHGMVARCHNPKADNYLNYGARGIQVCPEWRDPVTGPQAFIAYVEKLPHYGEPGRTLDRVNNDRGYAPGNVQWSTRAEQSENRRVKAKSGYVGVRQTHKSSRYQYAIKRAGDVLVQRGFKTALEAHEARQAKVAEIDGG